MTRQTADSRWKEKVDSRLDALERGSGELMTLVQHIDKNLAALVNSTQLAVALSQKAHWWGKGITWVVQSMRKTVVLVGEVGFGVLMISTIIYIATRSSTVRDFFIAFKWGQ